MESIDGSQLPQPLVTFTRSEDDSGGFGREKPQRILRRCQRFQLAFEPLKTLISTLPEMPGIEPVPVYCQNTQGRPGYLYLGSVRTERSQY